MCRTLSVTDTVWRWTVTRVPSQRSVIVQAVPRTVAEEYRPRVRYRPLALECSVFTTEAAVNASNTDASAALALQEENDFAPGAAPASSDSVVSPLLSPDLLCATLHTPPLNVPF